MAGKAVEKRGGGVAPYKSAGLPALSAEEVRSRVNLIQQVMKGVMKRDVHYGEIPGAGKKPMLFKPGAETLSVTFQLSHEYEVEDLSTDDSIRYRVRDRIGSQATERFICEGVGEASSDEEKYRWRKAICDAEFDDAQEDRRRLVWKKGVYENGRWNAQKLNQVKQVRTHPADIANTVLKMAKKRAQTDGVLTATGASDVFGQDMEDLPVELRTNLSEELIDAEIIDETPVTSETLASLLKLAASKDNTQGRPVTQKAILTNLKRQFGYEGKLDEITQPMAEATMAGLHNLADLKTEEAAGDTGTGQGGHDTSSEGEDEEPPGRGPKQASKNPRLAKLCILWNKVLEMDLDGEGNLRQWLASAYKTEHRSELTEEQQGEVIEVLEKTIAGPES